MEKLEKNTKQEHGMACQNPSTMLYVEPTISLTDANQKEFMRFESTGDIYWNGRKVECDKELAQAFTYTITEMSGLTPKELIQQIIKDNK